MATIEIDGKEIEVDSGKMVIEAADDAGVSIPRFCYHKKLSVAANCRMCLVEIDKIKKPMPACATPVTDGMKVFTQSAMALAAQKAVMEFLLINHPLDCPICDQGGECELQDVSMGYGKDVSYFSEGKRAVEDDDLGPLIATEMTRCIHCTRCVRFGEEVAGLRELGATGRGEKMHIGTYVKHSMTSEVSGNIIDLCPVGALTSKPYRFTARAWEINEHESIASHDCIGSNVRVHTRGHEVMRVVPRENERINETWLSDRDRFSYLGQNAKTRLTSPMVKKDGVWCEVDWHEALERAVCGIKKVIENHGKDSFAAFTSAQATTEEAFLLQKWLRGMGVNNLDCRIHQSDFRDSNYLLDAPITKHALQDIESSGAVLLLGSDVQREQPLFGLRVRKASLNGAKIFALNVIDYDFNFSLEDKQIVPPNQLVLRLAAMVKALVADDLLPDNAKALLADVEVDNEAKRVAEKLNKAETISLVLGAIAHNHPDASHIRSLVDLLALDKRVRVYHMSEGANEAGCHYAGMLPHRGPFGAPSEPGLDIQRSLAKKMRGFLLHQLEGELDIENPNLARQSLLGAEFVVMLSAFKSDNMLNSADVLLPIATVFETSGTFVNVTGEWQSFKGVVRPKGEARPAWKVLRVLANMSNVSGFDYVSSDEVLDEIKGLHAVHRQKKSRQWYCPEALNSQQDRLVRIGSWPMYRSDGLTRHAEALQRSAANEQMVIRVNSDTAKKFVLSDKATISQGAIEITLPLVIDDGIPKGAVYVANGWSESADLGNAFAACELK